MHVFRSPKWWKKFHAEAKKNREIENDKSAPLIVTKVVNLSFKNFDIEFKNIETIKGTNITTNKIYSNLTPR